MTDDLNLTIDHQGITDDLAARRYFAKFERVTGHLARVAAEMEVERSVSKRDVAVLSDYIARLALTFRALGHKYLLTGQHTLRAAPEPGRVRSALPGGGSGAARRFTPGRVFNMIEGLTRNPKDGPHAF